jgi:hypothetical protein
MADYQATRDATVAEMYALTTELATLEPPSAEMQQLLFSLRDSQAGMDLFARVNAGVTQPRELFAPSTGSEPVQKADDYFASGRRPSKPRSSVDIRRPRPTSSHAGHSTACRRIYALPLDGG